jgi:hypothetical protein
MEQFLSALPAAHHLPPFAGCFQKEVPVTSETSTSFSGDLLERAGERSEALATYRTLHGSLAREGGLSGGGPLPEQTVEAIQRLSKE